MKINTENKKNNAAPCLSQDFLEKLRCPQCNASSFSQKSEKLICQKCRKEISFFDEIPLFLEKRSFNKWNHWNCKAEQYEEGNAQIPAYRFERIDLPQLEYVKGDVLEIGCGTGRLAPDVERRGGKFFGVDPYFPFLKFARDKRGLQRLVIGQAEKLPFRDESFDMLMSGYFAFRYVNPKEGLPEARRVLKKGGYFVFDLLNTWHLLLFLPFRILLKGRFREFYQRYFKRKCRPKFFEFKSISDFKKQAEVAGFSVESITSTVGFPFLKRFKKKFSRYYFKRWPFIYLGFDIIIVLKAK